MFRVSFGGPTERIAEAANRLSSASFRDYADISSLGAGRTDELAMHPTVKPTLDFVLENATRLLQGRKLLNVVDLKREYFFLHL
jgi:hypothetical protein